MRLFKRIISEIIVRFPIRFSASGAAGNSEKDYERRCIRETGSGASHA